MNRIINVVPLCLVAWLALPAAPASAQVVIMHSFAGGANDGQHSDGSLIQSGSTLYGMTYYGGSATGNGYGTIFQIGADGNNFNLVHRFAGGPTDGAIPYGSLVQFGTTLFGMTQFGGSSGTGANGVGAVVQVATDGTGYGLLRSFAGPPSDGSYPNGSLVQSGASLYGMTLFGGSGSGNGTGGVGTVFKLSTDGSSYSVLHSFGTGPGDGEYAYGSLVQSGGFLYGMTYGGGNGNKGTIFRQATDGTGYTVMHTFGVNPGDGTNPHGSLTLSGTNLYGMTTFGGNSGNGTVFKIGTDGGGYGVMRSFAGGPGDGSQPNGSLTLVGGTLYGMTTFGGATTNTMGFPGDGTLFQILTDGTGYNEIYSFGGLSAGDGSGPYGDLLASGTTLYGMTEAGGSAGLGTIFSIAVPEPSSLLLLAAAAGTLAAIARRRLKSRFGKNPVLPSEGNRTCR